MISALATPVCTKGRTRRPGFGGIILHDTGSGVLKLARRKGESVEQRTARFYAGSADAWPDYLVGGMVQAFGDDGIASAHAAWRPWEIAAYRDGSWRTKWAKDYRDAVVAVPRENYAWWVERWQSIGYASPLSIITSAWNGPLSPNRARIGIEMLHDGADLALVGRLVADILRRHAPSAIEDVHAVLAKGRPHGLVCGHEDVSPCRRTTKTGRPWDPGDIDWSAIAAGMASG